MTREEAQIARIMFKNRLLKANGESFQQLFAEVMHAKYGQDFITIRPQGRYGDGGNDGYLPGDGHYFQVYGPIDPSDKAEHAARKLKADFTKIKETWSKTTEMLRYSFAYNDKYEGTFKEIAEALATIEKDNQTVSCRPFTAADLEDVFMSLGADDAERILGAIIPNPSKIKRVDYTVLKEVIDFIMTAPAATTDTRFGELPDVNQKIKLNRLSSAWGDLISSGARHSGHVDNYFSKNSQFARQTLRDHIVEIYRINRDAERLTASIPAGITREDLIFDDLRRALCPPHASVGAVFAVDILIGYYFEFCDIFDPFADKEQPGASA